MKNAKKIVLIMLLIPCGIAIFGLTKYNANFSQYINHPIPKQISNEQTPKAAKSEVHILGTVHFESVHIKREHLYKRIAEIAPDIILYESDSNTVKKILSGRDYFSQVLDVLKKRSKTKMEKQVVLKYITHKPDCVVLPYEWEIKDQFQRKHKIRSKPVEMIKSIIELENENILSEEQSTIINRYLELTRELNKIGSNGTFGDINSPAMDSLVAVRQYYQYTKLQEIVNERKELTEYVEFAQINKDYWDTRNKAMAQNILRQVRLNPNKKIVVLNGFYHRYFLIDELKKYEQKHEFSIK
jgi:pheromone shutdown protein TraB